MPRNYPLYCKDGDKDYWLEQRGEDLDLGSNCEASDVEIVKQLVNMLFNNRGEG